MAELIPREDEKIKIICRLCDRKISSLFYSNQDRICEVCWRKINEGNTDNWDPNL